MGVAEELKFSYWDDAGTVVHLIKNWIPGECKNEKDYEKSLYPFLHAELGSIQITKQPGYGRLRADLAVGKNVLVELKHNLDSTAKLQRLIGQLEGYRESDKTVIVVLTGRTEPNLGKELRHAIEKMNYGHFKPLLYEQFHLVEK